MTEAHSLMATPAGTKRFDRAVLPPLPPERRAVYAYYRLDFDAEGCPMRRMEDGRLVFHPILVPYLVKEYLRLAKLHNDPNCTAFAMHIMDLALARAEPGRDELIFLYDPASGLSTMPHTFYSALTQSWYVKALAELERVEPGRYKNFIQRAFASLTIPIEQGGVLLERDFGLVIEEYPRTPALYTLNGWLTALRFLLEQRDVLAQCGIDITEFLQRNLDAVEYVLPLYDAGFCDNTRYQLSGFTRLRFVADRSASLVCKALSIHIPGEKSARVDLALAARKSRWANYLERDTGRLLQFNIVQSLISYPFPNTYSGVLECARECRVRVQLANGDYDPMLTALPTTRWRDVGDLTLSSGSNDVTGELYFDDRNLFAYPTNFVKRIGGKHYNAYHFLHIIDLAVLYALCGRPALADAARRWMGYLDRWPGRADLSDRRIALTSHVYGDRLEAVVERYLSRTPDVTV